MRADRRVARFANFVAPTSGGIRSVLRRLAVTQATRGITSHIVAPGPAAGLTPVPGHVEVHTLTGRRLHPQQPYRLITDKPAVRDLLDRLEPDVVEVHDQMTLAWLGEECRRRGILSVLVAHERLDLLVRFWSHLAPASWGAQRWIRTIGGTFDHIVTPSHFAAIPYLRHGLSPTVVPWGVDHQEFSPPLGSAGSDTTERSPLRLMHVGRLSREKDPTLSAQATRYLLDRGVPAHLTVIGTGPVAAQLRDILPPEHLTMLGFVDGTQLLSKEIARADVFLAPGPFETFGVGALEAMACGLPVVCRESGSVSEIPTTTTAPGTPAGFGEAALRVSHTVGARFAAHDSSLDYTWDHSADALGRLYVS